MRVLIDTNVLISAALSANGTPYQAYVKAASYPNRGLICEQKSRREKSGDYDTGRVFEYLIDTRPADRRTWARKRRLDNGGTFKYEKFGGMVMKRELGIARCGLACCLCSENVNCSGCDSGQCPDKDWCENRKCSILKGIAHCYECDEKCSKGLLGKIKPYAFTEFARRYGEEMLLDCLERNEKNGVVYHREGINGDYDDFDDVEELMEYIKTGKRR